VTLSELSLFSVKDLGIACYQSAIFLIFSRLTVPCSVDSPLSKNFQRTCLCFYNYYYCPLIVLLSWSYFRLGQSPKVNVETAGADRCHFCRPANSVKALNEHIYVYMYETVLEVVLLKVVHFIT